MAMTHRSICYCGLYCENCAVKARVHPAAKTLYSEMKTAGFEEFIRFMPGGSGFWTFLKGMAEEGVCPGNCKGGSGNPGCKIRICAKEKNVEVCVQCKDYPCKHFDGFFAGYPILERDNALLVEKGVDEWMNMQVERREKGFTYQEPEQK
jgi:hypothetical protein